MSKGDAAPPKGFLCGKWAWSRLTEDDSDSENPEEERNCGDVEAPPKKSKSSTRTVLFVEGICCPSEIPIIERLLLPIKGVEAVKIDAVTKIVTVSHSDMIIARDLVTVLNKAGLGARERRRGRSVHLRRIPKRMHMASAFLLGSLLGAAFGVSVMWWLCALLCILLTMPKLVVRAAAGTRRCHFDMNVLILISSTGALAIGRFLEAATVVFLFSLSEYLEARVTAGTRAAIQEVLAMRPEEAELRSGERVPVVDVPLGAVVVIRQGDLVPVDGRVVAGSALIDESAVSGESKPISKGVGASVSAGTTTLSGYLEVETMAAPQDSTVAKLVQLIEDAQGLRSNTERLVERFARIYTPTILAIALSLMTIPWLVSAEVGHRCFYTTLVLLVTACPCALVISTPVTYLSGIACAATHNILVRGGVHLETMGRTTIVALDKTGTLTEGCFRLHEVAVLPLADDRLWRFVGSVEARSSHPLATTLVAAARENGVEAFSDVDDYEELPGEGVAACVDGLRFFVGSQRLADRMAWSGNLPLDTWAAHCGTVVWAGTEEGPWAAFSIADAPRPEAAEAMRAISYLGCSLVMLTGDAVPTGEAVGRLVGIADVKASLKPDDKISCVVDMQTKSSADVIAMVGDGVNDVPALAASHVGIAMGAAGRPAAMEAADVVLMDSDLHSLVKALLLGRRVLTKIQQNIAFALVSKLAMVLFALLGYVSLWGAISADVGAMLVVTLNGTSLMTWRRPAGASGPGLDSERVAQSAASPAPDMIPPPPALVPVCTSPCCEQASNSVDGGLCAGFGGTQRRSQRAARGRARAPLGLPSPDQVGASERGFDGDGVPPPPPPPLY